MSEEWKEVEVGNLPPDILVGDYEFEARKKEDGIWNESVKGLKNSYNFMAFMDGRLKYRCRKRQPKPPSHEEIMTKWWEDDFHDEWIKIIGYIQGDEYPYRLSEQRMVNSAWFTGRKSADIPPEANNGNQ